MKLKNNKTKLKKMISVRRNLLQTNRDKYKYRVLYLFTFGDTCLNSILRRRIESYKDSPTRAYNMHTLITLILLELRSKL